MDSNLDEILSGENENMEKTTLSNSDEVGIDDVLAMSEEEIDALLNARKNDDQDGSTIFAPEGSSYGDLMSSMGEASSQGDLGEINDLFRKEQEEIPVDPQIEKLLNNLNSDKLDFEDYSPEDLFEKKSPKRKKKQKGENGFFSKLFAKKEKAEKKPKDKKKTKETKKTKEPKKKEKNEEKGRKNTIKESSVNDQDSKLVGSSTNEIKDVDDAAVTSDFNLQDVEEFDIEKFSQLQTNPQEVEDGDIMYQTSDLFEHNENSRITPENMLENANIFSQEESKGAIQEFDAEELDQLLEIRDREDVPKDNTDESVKKKGLWGKIKDFLTDDEEEVEEEVPKKEKKSKKDKKKGAKKEDSEEGEEGASGKADKKAKKEKKPKVKKAKAPKEEDENVKKYPVKKMLLILLVFICLGSAFSLIIYLYMGFYTKQKGVEAYEKGEYMECYQNLYGQHLTDSQQVMFHKSEINLKMELAKKNYVKYKANGQELKALDHLVQFFFRYDDTVAEARSWNCAEVVQSTRDSLEDSMYNDFGVTIGRAKEIANMESDYDYTRALLNIVNGLQGETQKPVNSGEPTEEAYSEHIIPEEQDRVETSYIEP